MIFFGLLFENKPQDRVGATTRVPVSVLMAIIQLTEFLGQQDPGHEADTVVMTPGPPLPSEGKETLSLRQKSLREEILARKRKQKQQIENILRAEAVMEEFMQEAAAVAGPPTRPAVPAAVFTQQDGFMFMTLPVVI